MSSCNGTGQCIQQCICTCYADEECEIPLVDCKCGHRNHTSIIGGSTAYDMYCQIECTHKCKLIECHNFKLCGKKTNQYILDCNNGMCLNCAVVIGKIKFLNTNDECPICMENKDMIQLSCEKHNICLECWKTMSETEHRSIPLSCPMCRESIWKWNGR